MKGTAAARRGAPPRLPRRQNARPAAPCVQLRAATRRRQARGGGRGRGAARLHRDVALLDGEELERGVRGLARLGEAVHLHRQVVALRVPEQAHVCARARPRPASAWRRACRLLRCTRPSSGRQGPHVLHWRTGGLRPGRLAAAAGRQGARSWHSREAGRKRAIPQGQQASEAARARPPQPLPSLAGQPDHTLNIWQAQTKVLLCFSSSIPRGAPLAA